MHVQFSENTPNIARSGPNWLFDIDALTKSMNYKPVVTGNQSNGNAGTKACDDVVSKSSPDAGFKPPRDDEKKVTEEPGEEGGDSINTVGAKTSIELPDDPNMAELEDIVYSDDDEDVGAKWVFRNKKDERGIVIKNKAKLVAQGYTQEEGIDYNEVFSPVARIEALRLFLAYASFKDFLVYQMDVKSAFLYGKIEKEVYVCQPPGLEDPDFPDRDKGDILLVQVYVDDIIFVSTKKSLCTEFEKMMHKKFQMSFMSELTFFLGLQVKQKEDGIFISRDKYVTKILKIFGFTDVKTASTPMETQKLLLKDEDGEEVDVHLYRSMIGSLMYLTSSRPDIMFAVCACARYQVNPKVSHLHAVKRIFRYLKGQPKLGLWYPKDSPFDLVAYTDSDYAGASLDRKSTTGGCQFLRCRLISWQCKKQTVVANSTTEAEYVAASSCCGQVLWIQNQLLDYGYNFMHTKIYIDNESTICIVKNPVFHSKTKHIEIRHHFIRDSNEKKLIQMIKIHTDKNVADLLTKAINEDASKQGSKIDDIDKDAEIIKVDETQGRHDDDIMFDVSDLDGEEVFVAEQGVPDSKKDDVVQVNIAATIVSIASTIPVSATTITEDEIKSVKPKVTTATTLTTKEILLQEPSESIITTTTIPSKDKGKGIMFEEPLKMKKKDQISFDEQEAIRLQAEFDEKVRLAREKDEANVALIEEWNDIQAKINVDYQLAQRLQAQEQEELTIEERAKLLQQLLEKRRKHFATKRAEEKRNRPPTKAQQRSIMCTYLKNMARWKPKDLKNKSFDSIQKLFDKAMKRVNIFVDIDTELVKETKMKEHIEVVPDEEEVAIDAIPLATKPPIIVDFKILKEGNISYFQIIRADGSSKRYSAFIHMLRSFDREDLETLWKLVKAKHGYTRPEEDYERVLWGDLKTMFEPHVEDLVWRNLQGNKVLIWKLFDSCGVHFVRFQNLHVFMLVEKKYPLTPATITEMLNKKLQADHWNEMFDAAGMKVTTAERLQLLEEFMLTEKRSKTYQRKNKD
ncbi:putative ribonuclease H-like domain-containing protein [Tanacetum coccineum]